MIMTQNHSLLPRPRVVEELGGELQFNSEMRVGWEGAEAEGCAKLLAGYLRPSTGFAIPVLESKEVGAGSIQLIQNGVAKIDDAGFTSEDYRLEVAGGKVRVESATGAGLARGIQTLRQLFPPEVYAEAPQSVRWSIPVVRIEDSPRLRWRGLHLDVCRHFFSVAEVCRFIELMAQHRFNVCHLHLSDDQGWRIEIKRYPRLTEIGSKRECTIIGHDGHRPRRYDGVPYGGFFTQQDIRMIVAYAAERHITIVPEIDMPGHMQAAISVYPELGNTNAQLKPRCHWGISQSILNVEESTVAFMCNVLDEVMEMFPSRFIHVGGDEALKHEWTESARAQFLMAERSLANEHELQSWFIRQLGRHVTGRGRRLIGWDEILEGGLAEGAAVMSWRGESGGVAAVSEGHDVVMAPCEWVYFDHYQEEPKAEEPLAIGGMTTLSRVYAYEPVPAQLTAEKQRHVLGAQGQLWTEYITDMAKLEYMTYPRACALSEVLWLDAKEKNYPCFLRRLAAHRRRLDILKVNAHPRP